MNVYYPAPYAYSLHTRKPSLLYDAPYGALQTILDQPAGSEPDLGAISESLIPNPIDTGLEGLFTQRRDVLESRIRMLQSDIDIRYTLRTENLDRINQDQCSVKNLLYGMDRYRQDKVKFDLEKKWIDLEQEKRQESVGFFRDILFLKKELRDNVIEWIEERQKMSLFTGQQPKLQTNEQEVISCNP